MREKRPSVPQTEEDDDVEASDESGKSAKSKMFSLCKEFCFVLAVTFTAYATVLNSQVKTLRGPLPVPFFHRGSLVEDFYRGDLMQLMHQVSNAGLAFVMFYAPWDADSQDVRDNFEETAQFYFKQLYFAGVNCWEPGSECRTTFKELTIFPQLIAYNGPRKAIEYRGPPQADHMIRFLHSLLHPIHRVNTLTDIWRLRYLHDAVVVGHLKFNGMMGGVSYQVLYETALRFAGRDHERRTAFAVFTDDKINSLMNVSHTPTIVLHLWDQKLVYTGEMNTDSLYRWLAEHTTKGLALMNSNTLLPHMKPGGAMVVMFTPRHPLVSLNPYYQMFRRVAMKFNSCGNSSKLADDDFLTHILKYEDLYMHYGQEILRAEKMQREECKLLQKPKMEKCTVVTSRLWDNFTCYETLKFCSDNNLKYRDKLRNTFRENEIKSDWRSTEQVMAYVKRENCALIERTPTPLVPRHIRPAVAAGESTSCQLNTTVTFVALDSYRQSHLARALGIDLRRKKHNTAIILFNHEETIQLKSEEVREDLITQLLSDFVAGQTKRFLRSGMQKRKFAEPMDNSVSVIEVNTHSFESIVLNNTQTVVVFYHSSYCSFCRAISPLFLFVAYLLRRLPGLSMVMLDGESNDLPWQYTVHTYPSILIFPAFRKEESRVFPQRLPVTAHSLSQFILANLDVEERIQGMLALCSKWGSKPEASEEGGKCLQQVRIACLELISETLRRYRSMSLRLKHTRFTNQEKHLRSHLKRLLLRLQYLKSAHLHAARVPDIDNVLDILQKFQTKLAPLNEIVRTKFF